ncbi:MAG: NUDIX domain-containing protein [Candidatus Pacearchaeota archaeon]|nr:MAG: NUDIX domain-containing protein [Candidatus Pacearchaeota archaeon]
MKKIKKYKRFRKGIFCVVYALPLRYLLLHRKLHWKGWEFPKGGKKEKEILENTVKREVREETGLKIIKIKRFPVKGKFRYDKKTQEEWKAKGFNYVLFSCKVKKARVRISRKEHNKYKWYDYNEAIKLLKWPSQRKSLKIVNKFIKQDLKTSKN